MLDVFTFFIMVLLIAVIIILVVILGSLPGKIARQCNHPQADAVRVCGWLGIVTVGILWPVALIWAYLKPVQVKTITSGGEVSSEKELLGKLSDISNKLDSLEKKVSVMESDKAGNAQ